MAFSVNLIKSRCKNLITYFQGWDVCAAGIVGVCSRTRIYVNL